MNGFTKVKNVLRILSTLCILFAICPSFLVSCSEKEVKVNVFTAVGGVSAYGERVVDPHPLVLVCFIIPIVALVFLFMKKSGTAQTAIILCAMYVFDLIMWFVFKNGTRDIAYDNGCDFEITMWFVFNIIAIVLLIVINLLVAINKINSESDLMDLLGNRRDDIIKINNNTSQSSTKNFKFCMKCGTKLDISSQFCSKCGNKCE